ncbi:hypothetical protein H0H92_009790 [Tricholoma furcatifolium]|nr:hypothetical protein H0H92_009790 [Tricholoma furcatifolium]
MQDSKETLERRRFYKREWRRHKALLPSDRPLFDCRRCCSINTLVPLCLWCRWTSEEACRKFEESMHHVRARRASTPSKIVWKIENTDPAAVSRVHSSAPQKRLSETEPAGDKSNRSCGSTSQPVTLGNKATYLAQPEHSRRPAWLKDIDTNFKGIGLGTTLPKLRRSLSTGVASRGRNQIPLVKTMSTKSLRSAHIVIDFNALHDAYDDSLKETPDNPLTKPEPPLTPKTLRRKKRLSLLRTSKSSSRPNSVISTTFTVNAPSIVSHAVNASGDDDVFCVPSRGMKRSSIPSPARPLTADNTVPLGHPRRPFYTAIRPNMSRPTSIIEAPPSSYVPPTNLSGRPSRPMSLPAQIRAPSPGLMSVFSVSPFDDDDEGPRTEPSSAYRPRSSSHLSMYPPTFGPMSRHGGFSLSGETELRMQLAGQGQHEEGAFKFKDMGKRRGSMVMNKVRELKKGLKGLVRGSYHAS